MISFGTPCQTSFSIMLPSVRRAMGVGLLLVIASLLILMVPANSLAFVFGVNADNWSGQVHDPEFESSLKAMKVEFIVWHISPEEEIVRDRLLEIVDFCRRNNFAYLFNTEMVNYAPNVPYFRNRDGTYRWDLRPTTLEFLKDDPLFIGVVYDEAFLMQALNKVRIDGKVVLPYFADTSRDSVLAAHKRVVGAIEQINRYYGKYGKKLVFEMVFPDYAHAASRAGAITAPKLLKENFNDLMYSVYAGASIQYKRKELWACIDLWFLDTFPLYGDYGPGFHTPEELFDTLVFSYQMGFDYVYIEHMKGLVDEEFHLTDYGKQVLHFHEIKGNLSSASWKTSDPDFVVKRFPDGYWGQQYSAFIPNHPYGSWVNEPRMKARSLMWLKTLNRLSGGRIPPEANNWNATKHPFFRKRVYQANAGLPSMLVFDHTYNDVDAYRGSQFIDLTAP